MLQKSFSEGIMIEKVGPYNSTSFRSTSLLSNERSYRSYVYMEPKLVPKRSYLTANGSHESFTTRASTTYNRACSLSNGSVRSYESSVSIDQEEDIGESGTIGRETVDGLKCLQNIELVPGLVMRDYSETVNIFPKISDQSFRSTVTHDDCHLKKNYIVGLEVQKFREVTLASGDSSCFTSTMHITPVSGNDIKMNGECDDLL